MQTLDACFPIESDPSHQYHSWSCQVWCRPCHVWGEDPYGHALPEGVSKGQSRTVGLAWFVGWVKCIDHPLCMACINEFIFITTKGTIEIIMIAIVVTDIDCAKQYSVVLCQFLWIWNPPGLSEAFSQSAHFFAMTGWVPDMDALILRLIALDVPKVTWLTNKRCIFIFFSTIILEVNMVHMIYLQQRGVTKVVFMICNHVTLPSQNKLETSIGHEPKAFLHWPRHLYGQSSWLHFVGFQTFPRT